MFTITCKKPSDPAPHKNTLSAYVNGNSQSYRVEVSIWGSTFPGTRGVSLMAKINQEELYLSMHEYDGTKSTFTLDDQSLSHGAYCIDCGLGLSGSHSGEIKIVSFDKSTYKDGEVITGTFQFETDWDNVNYSITNGHFSVFVPNY